MEPYTRLADYGRSVLGVQPSPQTNRSTVYPFWSPNLQSQPSLLRHTSVPVLPKHPPLASLRSQVKELEGLVAARTSARRSQALLAQMNSLMSLMDRPGPDPALEGMMETMKEQQRTLTEMVQSMRNSPQAATQPIVIYTQQPQQEPPKDPIQDRYDTIKRDPRQYRRLLEHFDPEKDISPLASRPPSTHISRTSHIRTQLSRATESPEPLEPALEHEEKLSVIKDMGEAIQVFLEVATTWAVKAIRAPLTSVLNDPDLDLNILTKVQSLRQGQGRPDQINTKVLKIQVRVKGILEGLSEEIASLPSALCAFLQRMTSNGALIPHAYMLGFERSRLDFDAQGALRSLNKDTQKMLLCLFFLNRVVISRLLLNGHKNGLPYNPNTPTAMYLPPSNLKVLASILELMTLTAFVRLNRSQADGSLAEEELKNRPKRARLPYVSTMLELG